MRLKNFIPGMLFKRNDNNVEYLICSFNRSGILVVNLDSCYVFPLDDMIEPLMKHSTLTNPKIDYDYIFENGDVIKTTDDRYLIVSGVYNNTFNLVEIQKRNKIHVLTGECNQNRVLREDIDNVLGLNYSFCWEYYGDMSSVINHDLFKRLRMQQTNQISKLE